MFSLLFAVQPSVESSRNLSNSSAICWNFGRHLLSCMCDYAEILISTFVVVIVTSFNGAHIHSLINSRSFWNSTSLETWACYSSSMFWCKDTCNRGLMCMMSKGLVYSFITQLFQSQRLSCEFSADSHSTIRLDRRCPLPVW